MATPPPPPNPPTQADDIRTADTSVSWFQKTVTLRDWWLVESDREAQGKRLAVAGFSFSENGARRFFKSAPIAKRYDVFTLETVDRIAVVLQGFINEQRAVENGFSSEAINQFFFGFPFCWEEYARDCLDEVIDPGADVRDASGLSEPPIDPEGSRPTFTSTEGRGADQDAEVATVDNSNLYTYVPDLSVKDKSNILNHCVEGLKELPIPCDNNISESLQCSSTGAVIGTARHEFWKDIHFPRLTSCHLSAVNFVKETAVLPAEPSSNIMEEPSCRTVQQEKSSRTKRSTDRKSNIKQSASVDGIAACDSSLEQSLCLQDSAVHNVNVPDTEHMVCVGTPGMTQMGISSGTNVRETREENESNRDGSNSSSSFPQDPEGMLSRENALLRSPSIGNTCFQEQMENSRKDAIIVNATELGVKVVVSCPSNVEGEILVAGGSDRGKRNCAKNLKDDKIQKLHEMSPLAAMPNIIPQNASDLNEISILTGSPAILDAEVTSSKAVRHNLLSNLKDGKTQNQNSSCEVHMKRKDKKSSSEAEKHLGHRKLKRDSSTRLSFPTEVNVMEAMLRAGRTLRSSSTRSRSQEKCGQRAFSEGSSSRKRAKRKIEFDIHVTPQKHRMEKKTCIVSAESLSFKRSRSGRLLLPTLDFWRNQIPVYDAERNITGIREEVDA